MSLLELEHVDKRHRERRRERIVLADVSLTLEPGELAVLYGQRRSGRSTLLRVAAGIEAPDSGSVRFDGADLRKHSERLLGTHIGYVRKHVQGGEEQGVLEQVAAPLLARGATVAAAHEHARGALARADAERCAALAVCELSAGEGARVALARTLALAPRLLVIDEPVAAVGLSERDGILALLRTLAGEGVTVLASTDDAAELAGADRALTLEGGRLTGQHTPRYATVVALPRRSA